MNLLFITHSIPTSNGSGVDLRNFHFLRALYKNYNITLLVYGNGDINESKYKETINMCENIYIVPKKNISKYDKVLLELKSLVNKIPRRVLEYTSSILQKKINEILQNKKFDFIHCSTIFLFQNINNEIIDKYKIILDYNDCESLNLRRRMDKLNFVKKIMHIPDYIILRNYETIAFKKVKNITCVSAVDAEIISKNANERNKIHDIPVGVDSDYYNYNNSNDKSNNEDKSINLIFTGRMSYLPNQLAVHYIYNQLLPKLLDRYPSIKIYIVGSNPPNNIKKYNSDNMIITGYVDDLRDFFKISDVFICPLEVATGIQIKVLEAMAMGLPCVISKYTFEGMHPVNDELIVCELDDFFDNIVEVIENKSKSKSMRVKARKYIEKYYDWNIIEKDILNWYKRI